MAGLLIGARISALKTMSLFYTKTIALLIYNSIIPMCLYDDDIIDWCTTWVGGGGGFE
jgi:hypothetical protein